MWLKNRIRIFINCSCWLITQQKKKMNSFATKWKPIWRMGNQEIEQVDEEGYKSSNTNKIDARRLKSDQFRWKIWQNLRIQREKVKEISPWDSKTKAHRIHKHSHRWKSIKITELEWKKILNHKQNSNNTRERILKLLLNRWNLVKGLSLYLIPCESLVRKSHVFEIPFKKFAKQGTLTMGF